MAIKFDEARLNFWTRMYWAGTSKARQPLCVEAATDLRCSPRTFRRHVARGSVGRSPPQISGRHRSKARAHLLADEYVQHWLSTSQPTASKIYLDYRDACTGQTQPLSVSAFRRKIAAVTDKERFERRGEAKFENVAFRVIKGHAPRRTAPLEAVQIDHTQLDVEAVDRFGGVLGRPWFTAVIDEYTRALVGFYVSMLPPQRFTVGQALARAIFPKDEWLARIGVEGRWDMQGVPFQIGSDNGSDLAAEDTLNAYKALRVTNVDFRPEGEPQYGAAIERFMGTVATLAKGIPGYTGPNYTKKPPRSSKSFPCLTIDDLEAFIARWAVTKYNQKSVGRRKPPQEAWDQAKAKFPPTMALMPEQDRETVEKLFLPSLGKTVTAKGVQHLHLFYRSEYLNGFLLNADKTSRSITIRIDPRSIMQVYHHDALEQRFERIPVDEPDYDLDDMSWNDYELKLKPLIAQRRTLDPELEVRGRAENRKLIEAALAKQGKTKRELRSAETKAQYQARKAVTGDDAESLPIDLPPTGTGWLDLVRMPNTSEYH
jgi:putative transposase